MQLSYFVLVISTYLAFGGLFGTIDVLKKAMAAKEPTATELRLARHIKR